MDDNPEYEKMPKSLKNLGLSEKEVSEINKLTWCVTEKVHGANFSFVYENGQMYYAKRKQFLNWTDDFFGFQNVVNQIENKLIEIFEKLVQRGAADRYIIYGELFGGKYPHENVIPNSKVQAIQTGVYYSPDILFCAFDIAFEVEGVKTYLDYEKAISYFKSADLLHAKSLFAGKLKDALEFNTRINSYIPEDLGLPKIDKNMIEGIVLKPLRHYDLIDFDRPVIKIKNPEFDEEKKFHEAEKWSYIPDVSSNNEELNFIVDEFSTLINRNRMESVLSKTGGIDLSNIQRMEEIRHEFMSDIMVDFTEGNEDLWKELNGDQQVWILNRVRARIENIIINYSSVV